MGRPRDDRQRDLLQPALDQTIDMKHPLVLLSALGSIGTFSTAGSAPSARPGRASQACRPGWWPGCSS